ncbi:MAG: DMT family transporter [Actinomycetota bacterium]|nr:DMT family transporter [Actinomycetota bacterium]
MSVAEADVAALNEAPQDGRVRAPRKGSSPLVWMVVLAVSVLWGTEGVATRVALEGGTSAYAVSSLRLAIASLFIGGFLAIRQRKLRVSRHVMADGVVMAIAQVVVPPVLFAASLRHLNVGTASLMFALAPAVTVLWMRLLSQTKHLGMSARFGLLISGLGAATLVLAESRAVSPTGRPVVGAALVLSSVSLSSFAGVYSKRHARHPALQMMAPEIFIGTAVLLTPGLLVDGWGSVSLKSWAAIGYLGIAATLLPLALLYWLVRRTDAVKASFVNYLFPVVAIMLGAAIYNEALTAGLAGGAVCLLTGVGVVEAASGDNDRGAEELRPCPEMGTLPVALSGSYLE